MSSHRLSSRQNNGDGGTNSTCIDPDPQNTVTDRMNLALNSSGPGYILKLCQGRDYIIQAPITLFANGQEISTEGYPIEQENGTDLRATLVVNGPVADGKGHTTAIDATCNDCSNIKIRHLKINGTRGNSGPTGGGANIEMGGPNSGQLVEYVKSFDPRSWSCLHIFEGALNCRNATIRYNDIGPCGTDYYMSWADGISLACADSHVHGNWVYGATDGGIVLFGSPGTVVENNTIWVGDNSQIGGINMVDVNPWDGNYTGTIVQNNTIIGGFATTPESGGSDKGDNNETATIKVGIAIGPRTWFGPTYLENISFSGTVLNNRFSGGFGYAIGINSAMNFTVLGNTLFGNTSFIGSQGPNCSDASLPPAAPFVVDAARVTESNIQTENMTVVPDADSLTCILPKDGNFWPYGGKPEPVVPGETPPWPTSSPSPSPSPGAAGKVGNGKSIALGVGIPMAIIATAVLVYYFRRWFVARTNVGVGDATARPLSMGMVHSGYERGAY